MSFTTPLLRLSAAFAALLPAAAFAGTPPNPLPEPETWALFAIAGVAAVIVTIRNRKK